MLWTQIAVAIDNTALALAPCQNASPPLEEASLSSLDLSDEPGRQTKAPVEQNAAIIGDVPMPLSDLCGWCHEWALGVTVESSECRDQPVELGGADPMLFDGVVERPAFC